MVSKNKKVNKQITRLPNSPGVYLFFAKNGKEKIIYIGKATNLRRRVTSYFNKPNNSKLEKLIKKISKISYKKTETALEALILESSLIKKYQPSFNIKEKDDKSFLYIMFTNEPFSRPILTRGKNLKLDTKNIFGPFVYAKQAREALKILRKIFPYNDHVLTKKASKSLKPCFNYELGLCPGTCIGAITTKDYKKNIAELKMFLRGKKKKLLQSLAKEMRLASGALKFEYALKLKHQIFALKHIQDVALIEDPATENWKLETRNYRIEGYDISNTSGTSAVGSMVVFINGKPEKSLYKKFKIRSLNQPNDVGMLREVLQRRFKHVANSGEWALPDMILIDGGKPQVGIAKKILKEAGVLLPIIGIAKGPKRNKNEFFESLPKAITKETLIKVRDEAHRFAINYHRKVRSKNLLGKK